MSGGTDVSLTIFISMGGSKSLTSFGYKFFHFRRSSGLKMALDVAKGCNQ